MPQLEQSQIECQKALDLLEELEEEYPDIFERGADFLEDVKEKLTSVQEKLDAGIFTQKMASAVSGWYRGVAKWHPQHKGD